MADNKQSNNKDLYENTCGKNPEFISHYIKNAFVSHRQSFSMQLIGECLVTHCELSPADIIWGLIYDFSKLTNEQLAIIVVHLCKTNDIGKFSLCFNFTVDHALINRNRDIWASLLNINHENAFPEYYEQKDKFTKNEQNTLEHTHTLEYNSAYQLIASINKVEFPLKQYLIHKCPVIKDNLKLKIVDGNNFNTSGLSKSVEVMSSPFGDGGITIDGKKNVTMYKNCYDNVCLMQNIDINLRAESQNDTLMVPDVKYINTGEGSSRMTIVNCMKVITLVRALTIDRVSFSNGNDEYITAINPGTNEPFDVDVYKMLTKRMSTEIKLYTYFVEQCVKSSK